MSVPSPVVLTTSGSRFQGIAVRSGDFENRASSFSPRW